jgi:hypothetical protein
VKDINALMISIKNLLPWEKREKDLFLEEDLSKRFIDF